METEINVDQKIAIEAARLFLSKTNKIDFDSDGFWPAVKDYILSMRSDAKELLEYVK